MRAIRTFPQWRKGINPRLPYVSHIHAKFHSFPTQSTVIGVATPQEHARLQLSNENFIRDNNIRLFSTSIKTENNLISHHDTVASVTKEVFDVGGSHWFAIPASILGRDDSKNYPDCLFQIRARMAVYELLQNIAAEVQIPDGLNRVKLLRNGEEIPIDTPVSEVLSMKEFVISIGVREMKVVVPATVSSHQPIASRLADDSCHPLPGFDELQKRAPSIVLARILDNFRTEGLESLSLDKFIQLAKENVNLDGPQALEVLKHLEHAGVVIHLNDSDDAFIKTQVYLNPGQILHQSLLKDNNHQLPYFDQLQRKKFKLLAKRKELDETLLPLRSLKARLDNKAEVTANNASWIGAVGMTAVALGLLVDTYSETYGHSWDLVEPISYFIVNGFGVIGYLYWLTSDMPYSFRNLKTTCRRQRQHKYYKEEQFDPSLLVRLEAEKQAILQEIHSIEQKSSLK